MKRLRPLQSRQRSESVESLTARISSLKSERQELRAAGASETKLERNRAQLCRAQWDLSYALIDRYLIDAAAQTAA